MMILQDWIALEPLDPFPFHPNLIHHSLLVFFFSPRTQRVMLIRLSFYSCCLVKNCLGFLLLGLLLSLKLVVLVGRGLRNHFFLLLMLFKLISLSLLSIFGIHTATAALTLNLNLLTSLIQNIVCWGGVLSLNHLLLMISDIPNLVNIDTSVGIPTFSQVHVHPSYGPSCQMSWGCLILRFQLHLLMMRIFFIETLIHNSSLQHLFLLLFFSHSPFALS